MKRYQRIISIVMSAFLLLTTVPAKVLAEQKTAEQKKITTSKEVVKNEPKILKELTELREKNVKHYLRDDGSYEAAIYPKPVHYLDNGEWKDIDNTLIEADDKENNGKKILTTKANDYSIKLDKNVNSDKLVSIQKDKYKVAWSVENAKDSQVKVGQVNENDINADIQQEVDKKIENVKFKNDKEKAKTKTTLVENEKKKTLKNLSSEAIYKNIFTDIDLEYILNSNSVKENIILNKPSSIQEFTFNLKVENLTPQVKSDNSIVFYDSKDLTKEVFKMQSPYMIDANKESSNKINVSLDAAEEGYKLILKPDDKWLHDISRVYPVTIDPPISTSLDISSIHDAYVSQALPNNNYYSDPALEVGKHPTAGVTHSYIMFDLPALRTGSIIVNAQLNISLLHANFTTTQINAHKVNGNWSSKTITWNNAPSFDSVVQDYQLINGNYATRWYFDVTSIVKDWYTTGINNGLMLKNDNESTGCSDIVSSDSGYIDYRPQITFVYIDNSGLENYWTYHSQSVGRAGTGYVNDYTGNLVFIHDDLNMSGNRMPVNIKHVYNSSDNTTDFGFGKGWRLNISQIIYYDSTVGEYYLIDEDGTKHYFYYDSYTSSLKDETGLNLTLTHNSDGTYTIKDKDGNQLIYTATRAFLWKIIDKNGNTQTLTYNGGVLATVTDGTTGRVTTLDSDANGRLLGITDPAGRRISYGYNGNNLQTITYPDGKQTVYNYDSYGNLISATNYNGLKTTYAYTAGNAHRVYDVLESNTDGTLGNETTIAYGNNLTTFTDVNGRKDTYQFNNAGNTLSIRDSQGNARYTQYFEFSNNANTNKVTFDSKLQKTTVNYLVNHSLESDGSWSFANDSPSTATGGFTTSEKYLAKRSLMVSKTNNSSRSYYQQSLTLQKGKTYTFSGYIKTNGITSTSGQGAHLLVHYKNNTGAWLETHSSYVSGTNDWKRYEVTFTIPSDAATADVLIRTAIANESGTAYFDCLQLEDGSVANRYNMLENGDFRNGSSFWSTSYCDTNDKLDYIDPSVDPNYASADIDRNSFKINGKSDKYKSVYQVINQSGSAGDTFVLSGWAKADSVPTPWVTVRTFQLELYFDIGDEWEWYELDVPFNTNSSDWQYVSGTIKVPGNYNYIIVSCDYYKNANTANFDGIRLYKEEFGNSYSYDSNGNLQSTVDIAKQNSTFQYNSTNDLIKATDARGNNFNYTYDNKHNMQTATTAENVVYTFSYDSNGNPLTSKVGDSTLFINSSATYTTSGNYMNSITDSRGNTVTYNWNETKGLLNTVTDAKQKVTTYNYEDKTDRLSSVYKTVDGNQVTNSYGYVNDRLDSITHNGFNYNFLYDSLGNNIVVGVAGQGLISNTIEPRTGKVLTSTYGNNQQVSNDYDSLDRVIGKRFNGTPRYTYEYDASGNIGYAVDLVNGVNYRYVYDISNRLVEIKDSIGNKLSYTYDGNSNTNAITETVGGATYSTNYGYDKDNKLKSVTYTRASSNIVNFNYDLLSRLESKSINTGSTTYNTTIGYLPGANGSTTNKVQSINNNGGTITYSYDANGNIDKITQGGQSIDYKYNELNELIREDNQVLNKIITYSYDVGGNIKNKIEYPYAPGTPETLGAPTSTINYDYKTSGWKDLLEKYDNLPITYDTIGNVKSYNGWTYSWEQGRQLSNLSGNGYNIDYKYNDSGIRTQKIFKDTNGNVTSTVKFHLVGGKVTFEDGGTDKIYYTYDSSDNLVSMNLSTKNADNTWSAGVEYYYIRNAQGDIIGLFDKNGATVASYTYDSWGNLISIKDGGGNDITNNTSSVGYKNPYRYRGYRYDTETKLYYLQSRYYNPEWGRFISADGIVGVTGELLSANMFAYCLNNPVNMHDNDGDRPDFGDGTGRETDEQRSASLASMYSASKNSNNGKANSKEKLYNKDGSVKQERAYGPDEKPLLDTDWNHGGVGHEFPHWHEWKDGVRQEGVPFQGPPPPPKVAELAVAGSVVYWVVSEGLRVVFPPRNLIPIP